MPTKRCTHEGCTKGAQGKTEFCKGHGGGERCAKEKCTKSAIGKTKLCIEHGGGERCTQDGCTKSAQGKTEFCKGHGGGKRCTQDGCTKSAQGKTEFCIEHGGGKRCAQDGCTKSAIGKEFCKGHGGGKRCTQDGCTKGARGNTGFCIEHGGGERCAKEKCTKSAIGKTKLCIEHGGGERCPHCITWPDSRGGCKKYDGYCATCFKHVFPTDPRSTILRQKSHETAVRNYLNEHMSGFIHDLPIYSGNCNCSHRRRIDFRMLIGGTILAVEVDEHQHSSYDKKDDEIRYDDLYMVFSGKWIFIRFNPDGYRDQNGNKRNPKIVSRLPVLLAEIKRQIERIEASANTELVEIHKLYYDGYSMPVAERPANVIVTPGA